MKRCTKLSLLLVVLYVASVNSLTCFKCDTGTCSAPFEEKDCAAGGNFTLGHIIVRRQDAAASPADGGGASTEAGPSGPPQCITLTGKKKGTTDEVTFRDCGPGGKCTAYEAQVEADGMVCTPCEEDKCNSGEFIKPFTLWFMMIIVALSSVIVNHHE